MRRKKRYGLTLFGNGRYRLESPSASSIPIRARQNRCWTRNNSEESPHFRPETTFDRSIDLQVSRLRQRLRDNARSPELIKTVRGEGYVLSAAVTVEA